jgi:hypothetical protein
VAASSAWAVRAMAGITRAEISITAARIRHRTRRVVCFFIVVVSFRGEDGVIRTVIIAYFLRFHKGKALLFAILAM